MSKTNKTFGFPVFGQLVSLLPQSLIRKVIVEQKADFYTKKFRTFDHLKVMLFAVLANCTSLREIESGIAGYNSKLLQLGFKCLPKRSTLSHANAKRSSAVFESIFKVIYDHLKPFLPDSYPKNQEWMQKLFLVDSTTITLFKDILKAAGRPPANGKKKGGVKIHVGMHLAESTPSLVKITSSATNDRKFMPKFKNIEPGTVLVFDKAYLNYSLYNHWSEREVIFVTRRHNRSVMEVIDEINVDQDQKNEGVDRVQEVYLGYSDQKEKVKCRLIYFYDKNQDRKLQFITNDFSMKPSQIAEIYKQRWQIELLFKRLKQNLQLYDFLGDNENAIRIQIWCNLIADLLLTTIRKGLIRKRAYSNIASLVRIHLMSYVAVKDLINNPGNPEIFKINKPPGELPIFQNHYP